jgi:hypothetical protein
VTGSVTLHLVRGASEPVVDQGSATFRAIKGASISNKSSGTFQSQRGTPILIEGLIRGPQFRDATIDQDRFVVGNIANVLSTASSVDLTAMGTSVIYTVPADSLVLIQGVILRATAGTVSTDATVSLGVNPSTTDLFDPTLLLEFRSVNDTFSLWSDKSTTVIGQAGETIDLDVTIAATGGLLTVDAYLVGMLLIV